MKPLNAGRWPTYSPACRRDVERLLRAGGSLTAYRSNPDHPKSPAEGSWARRLEVLAERTFGVRHAVATSSGTTALQAMLYASGLARGSTILTSPYTFSATPAAIIHAGMRPVFGDVNPETYCLDPGSAIGITWDAVMPVDLFGRVAFRGWHGMILADSCQAAGAYRWMAQALAAVFSFNGQKNVPAGEAGLLITDDWTVADRARGFVSHGENWGGSDVGMNGRLNELTACVAYHGLKALPWNNETRRRLARELWRRLNDEKRLHILSPMDIAHHALYVYPFTVADGVDRTGFVRRLKKLGVEAGEGYIRPILSKYEAFRDAVRGPLPVAEDLSERSLVLLLQVRPPATIGHMRYISLAIRSALDGGKVKHRTRMGHVEATAF